MGEAVSMAQQHQTMWEDFDGTDESAPGFKPTPTYKRPRPMSHWTKARVIEMCEAAGVPAESIDVLGRMSLEDIRATCLSYAGTFMTGSPTDPERTRHTRFWRLDFEYIRGLGGCE